MQRFEFRLGWFIIAFAVGVLYVYITHPSPTVVYKYPTPYNSSKTIYTDAAGNCYKFNVKTLEKCPDPTEKEVVPQPIIG